jgi:hypothetical protein
MGMGWEVVLLRLSFRSSILFCSLGEGTLWHFEHFNFGLVSFIIPALSSFC